MERLIYEQRLKELNLFSLANRQLSRGCGNCLQVLRGCKYQDWNRSVQTEIIQSLNPSKLIKRSKDCGQLKPSARIAFWGKWKNKPFRLFNCGKAFVNLSLSHVPPQSMRSR